MASVAREIDGERQNIIKWDMKVEDKSVKPRKILVGVIQLQVSISVTVMASVKILYGTVKQRKHSQWISRLWNYIDINLNFLSANLIAEINL